MSESHEVHSKEWVAKAARDHHALSEPSPDLPPDHLSWHYVAFGAVLLLLTGVFAVVWMVSL